MAKSTKNSGKPKTKPPQPAKGRRRTASTKRTPASVALDVLVRRPDMDEEQHLEIEGTIVRKVEQSSPVVKEQLRRYYSTWRITKPTPSITSYQEASAEILAKLDTWLASDPKLAVASALTLGTFSDSQGILELAIDFSKPIKLGKAGRKRHSSKAKSRTDQADSQAGPESVQHVGQSRLSATQLRSDSNSRFPDLTPGQDLSDTPLVTPNPYEEARRAVADLNQLTFPQDMSLGVVLEKTQAALDKVHVLAASRLAQLLRLTEMSAAEFFSYFDAVVDRMPHALLREHFQMWATAQHQATFDTFEEKRKFAANIQQRLKRLNLRVECPNCHVPANLRCVRFGNSKTGQFAFGHRKGSSEAKHAMSTEFPSVTLVTAPKDPRLKVI